MSPHVPPRAAPKLTAHPSGKLARRRQSAIAPFQFPELQSSKTIAVPPKRSNSTPGLLSKSDPSVSHMPPRKTSKLRLGTLKSRKGGFPICDDLTEAGDLSEQEYSPPPTQSPALRGMRYDDGPRTAPLTSSTVAFPFSLPPSPLAKKGVRRHLRSPSDGIFNMSSDEDRTPRGEHPEAYRDLLGLDRRGSAASIDLLTPEALLEGDAALVAGYFASSTFQNSPSPEELPPPPF